MKNVTILLLLILFTSCSMPKAPEFVGVTKIDLKKNNQGKLVLLAFAKYHNPNLVGGTFILKDVKVFVDDKYFANLNSQNYTVPAKKDFEIPLEVDFDVNYFKKKSNILGALNAALQNKLKVHYVGKIYYVNLELNIPYKIDYEQEVKIYQ